MATQPALDETQASWRDICEVHPCADVFPMMSDEEIDELANDIKDHGLRETIAIWRADADKPDRICILDGRNRLAALVRLGVTFSRPELEAVFPDGHTEEVFKWSHTTDPAAYVIGANIRRRHLTKKQQAELIVSALKAQQENDSAKLARSFSPSAGRRGGSTKDPLLEQAKRVAQAYGISTRTTERAHAKRHGKPRPRRTPTGAQPEPLPVAPPPAAAAAP